MPEKDNEAFKSEVRVGGRAAISEKKRLEVYSDAHRLGVHYQAI